MSGSFQQNYTDNTNNNLPPSRLNNATKRRRTDECTEMGDDHMIIRGRSFMPVKSGSGVYCTKSWKSGTSLFQPITQDMFVNLTKYDRVTATEGSFHTADHSGKFLGSAMGHVVHFWRYDKTERKCFVSLSILYTNTHFWLILSSDISLETSFQDVSNNISHDRIGQEPNEIFQTEYFTTFSTFRVSCKMPEQVIDTTLIHHYDP